jgi:hypothetical protein
METRVLVIGSYPNSVIRNLRFDPGQAHLYTSGFSAQTTFLLASSSGINFLHPALKCYEDVRSLILDAGIHLRKLRDVM